jgi:predicted enzyme related to lactoylglutathione lyase
MFGIKGFFEKNFDWKFDRMEAGMSVDITWVRWRKGPITFFRQHMKVPSVQDGSTDWIVFIRDDLGVSFHLPESANKLLDGILKAK